MDFPKIIFQTWKTKDVPEKWLNAQDSIKKMNPDFHYVLLTDNDNEYIVKTYFPKYLQYYNNFKYPIQRADIILYMILYLYGGIYIDLDYIAIKSFSNLQLNDKEVGLIKSNNVDVITNSFLISKPGSTFWLDCINEAIKPSSKFNFIKHLEIMNTTGPLMVNRVSKKHMDKIRILDSISVPCSVCHIDDCEINKDFIILPIKGHSWHSIDSSIINFIYCNYMYIITFITFITLTFSYFSKREIALN